MIESVSSGNGQGVTPAYKRIQSAILNRIETGELKPGDAVESERELAKIHTVSLMTARHALVALEREGRVQRRRGAGTFVAPPMIHFNKLTSFTELMTGRSLASFSKVLSFGAVNDEPDVNARLALAAGARLIKIERLRMGADDPFALETCYLSAADVPGLTRNALASGSLFSILQHDYGVHLSYADEEVDATASDTKISQLLEIQRGLPLLRIRQLIYSTKAKATMYVLGLYRSDRHTLLIRRFR
jgi:GntR family transcriptional regulator